MFVRGQCFFVKTESFESIKAIRGSGPDGAPAFVLVQLHNISGCLLPTLFLVPGFKTRITNQIKERTRLLRKTVFVLPHISEYIHMHVSAQIRLRLRVRAPARIYIYMYIFHFRFISMFYCSLVLCHPVRAGARSRERASLQGGHSPYYLFRFFSVLHFCPGFRNRGSLRPQGELAGASAVTPVVRARQAGRTVPDSSTR